MSNDTVTLTQSATQQRNVAPWTFEELISDVAALKSLLIQETQYLRVMNVSAVQAVHDTKLRLIRKLEIQKELMARNPTFMETLTDEQKRRMKEINAGLDRVMKENFHEVLKAREVNQCVVRAISREVRKFENRATGYTRQGETSQGLRYSGFKESGPAVALNEMI